MTAEWFSAIVAVATALVSLVFSVLSFLQAKSAIKRADHAIDLERASSIITHYLAVIEENVKLYEDTRASAKGIVNLVESSEMTGSEIRMRIMDVGDPIILAFENILIANADLIEKENFRYFQKQPAVTFFESLDAVWEVESSKEKAPHDWGRPLFDLALVINRYTGHLRRKLFEHRSKLVNITKE